MRFLQLPSAFVLTVITSAREEESNLEISNRTGAKPEGCPHPSNLNEEGFCEVEIWSVRDKTGLFHVSLDPKAAIPDLWKTQGSVVPLTFDQENGQLRFEGQWKDELTTALGDMAVFIDGAIAINVPDFYKVLQTITINLVPDGQAGTAVKGDKQTMVEVAKQAACVADGVGLDSDETAKAFDSGGLFKDAIKKKCGIVLEARLTAQVQRTALAMKRMFQEVAEVFACFVPGPQDGREKLACAGLAIDDLIGAHWQEGKVGPIWVAVGFATIYGIVADSMLHRPFFEELLKQHFDARSTWGPMNALKGIDDVERGGLVCDSVLAHQRAYEKMFLRFTASIQAYVKMYVLDLTTFVRTRPCQKVFYKAQVGKTGICRDAALDWNKIRCSVVKPFSRISTRRKSKAIASLKKSVRRKTVKKTLSRGTHTSRKSSKSHRTSNSSST